MIPDKVFSLVLLSMSLESVTRKAISIWEKALNGRVKINVVHEGGDTRQPDITVGWGQTDRSSSPDRIAQCTSFMARNDNGSASRRNAIILDVRSTWKISWGQRWIWGQGTEDALAAVLHELGHALGFPHSNVDSDVMNATCGSTVISAFEARLLCAFWDHYNHNLNH